MLAVSCGSESRPGNVLPEEKMVEVMVDVQIFEAVIEGKRYSDDSLAVLLETNYDAIFRKHGITEEQFHQTFAYYEASPAKMDAMMDIVVDKLARLEAETKRRRDEEKPEITEDSLKEQSLKRTEN